MRQQNTLLAIGFAILVIAAGLATAVSGMPAAGAGDGQTISVGATGQAEGEPDQATLSVAVVATAPSADAARQQVADNATRMRQALRDAGVADEDVRTAYYHIGQDYRYGPKEEDPREPQYRAVHAFEITVSDIDSVGSLIDTAVENGATEVNGVQFGLSDAAQRDLRATALEDAMDSANAQADTLAAAGDLQVVGVHTISTSDVSYPRYYESAVAGDAGGRTTIESGPVTVTAMVQVTYNATSA